SEPRTLTQKTNLKPETRNLEVLFAFRLVNVSTLTEEHFGTLHHGLRQRRMRGDHELYVFPGRAHFNCQRPFRDQLPRSRTRDADAEHAPGLRFEHELRQPLGAVHRDRAAQRAPWEFGHLDLDAFGLGL